MIKRIIHSRIAKMEQRLGGKLDYVRHIVDTSLPSFLRFVRIQPLSEYRRKLPLAPYYVARLAAARDADCGTCVQIEANLAKGEGMEIDQVLAAARGDLGNLSRDLRDVYRFTTAVVQSTGEENALRQTMQERYGEKGLVEMALAIGAARIFPEIKRTLGYATSCSLVDISV